MELHLAKALGAILHRLGQHLFGVGPGDVVAAEPGEPRWRRGLQRLHLFEGSRPGQQVRPRHPRTVEMRQVRRWLLTKMKVQVEDWRAPLVRRRRLPAESRHDGSGSDGFEELTTIDHTSSFRAQSGSGGDYRTRLNNCAIRRYD